MIKAIQDNSYLIKPITSSNRDEIKHLYDLCSDYHIMCSGKNATYEDIDSIFEYSDKKTSEDSLTLGINQVGSLNDLDNSKINGNIKILDKFNKELDKMIYIYDNNENMKNDLVLTTSMEEVKCLNQFVDSLMEEYNKIYSVDFNKSIKKIPVNMVVKSKGWYTVDKFTSIQ